MKDILFDFTYYQGNGIVHGGGEYGNVILEELLKQKEQINCGIFFLIGRPVDCSFIEKCRKNKWNIHAICDRRNITSIVGEYQYKTIYSVLPYSNVWKTLKLSSDVRFIGTIHGLRTLELADCESEESAFFKMDCQEKNADYVFGVENKEQRQKQTELYRNTLSAFNNCKIIVVSEHTKHSILYHYPELQGLDIEVLYSPLKLQKYEVTCDDINILNKYDLRSRNFGLIISAGIWYKNGLRAAMAYDRIFEKEYKFIPDDFKVVITGVKDSSLFLNRLKHKERFIVKGYVESEELECFYQNAQLFVYASLNEGFGYPPIEAMRYGTLCACSVNTSIAEVCHDMVLYFNPLLIDEIAIRILESFNSKIREEKRRIAELKLPLVLERQKNDLQRLVEIIAGEDINGN